MTRDIRLSEAEAQVDALLAACRARSEGIGFVGPDVPIDVLIASGRPFGHLPWIADDATPWADQWLESSYPAWARSILEQWHEGRFDGFDTIVFSRAEDASQRLYYYIRELQRRGKLGGAMPIMFDIALIPRASSLAHTEAAVLDLARALETSAANLEAGVESANRLRESLAQLEARRMSDGPLYERVGRAAAWSDARSWIGELELPVRSQPRTRVLLAGSVPIDDRLHSAVESAGASVVAEAHVLSLRRLGPVITREGVAGAAGRHAGDAASAAPDGGEPVARIIARHLRENSCSPRAFRDRAAWVVERAKDARADAVLLWLTREDEAYAWQVPAQRQALVAAGIATLVLPAARWQTDDETLDRIAGFCRERAHATA